MLKFIETTCINRPCHPFKRFNPRGAKWPQPFRDGKGKWGKQGKLGKLGKSGKGKGKSGKLGILGKLGKLGKCKSKKQVEKWFHRACSTGTS